MVDSEHPPGPPPRVGPRDPGDAWVEGPDGTRVWGRFGAAGLIVLDPDHRVLLQHRVEWSHFGGTWGIPGGARHEHEGALAAALREAGEEAGVPADDLDPIFCSVEDLGFWTYSTVVARSRSGFDPVLADAESIDLRWVGLDDVTALPLHPGFAASWPGLRPNLRRRLTIVVDLANLVGSRPDGWWRDRPAAAGRMLAALDHLTVAGIPSVEVGMPGSSWWPRILAVTEGQARSVRPATGSGVEVVAADRDGDQRIVEVVRDLADRGGGVAADVLVATSDAELRRRVEVFGAATRGAGWLRDALDSLS